MVSSFDTLVPRPGLAPKVVMAVALVLAPALGSAQTAQDQEQPAQALKESADAKETATNIVVTGSLIARDGYQAPTPVTVMTSQDIENVAAVNFVDFATKVPTLASGFNSHVGGDSNSDGNAGTNSLSLRELGANRTLVLLDGIRVTANNATGSISNGGSVDINNFPDALISRMDVVTGGATATYGSGALAGVVNLILDKNFTGLKASVTGGITSYGDDPQYAVSVTAGTKFADGRGHFLISVEEHYTDGIPDAQDARSWVAHDWGQITNPAYTASNGQPFYLNVPNAGSAAYAPGGLITSGPLKGTTFGPGGVPQSFVYGMPNDGITMQGGNYRAASGALNGNFGTDMSLDIHLNRQNAFFRTSYDLTDDIQVYGQYLFAYSTTYSNGRYNYSSGTIQNGNPYIPAPIQAQMTTQGISSFPIGNYLLDLGQVGTSAERTFNMFVVGVQGKFGALGTTWTWNLDATQSSERTEDLAHNVYDKADFSQSLDAVRNPINGQIVCASTLTNPGNGCVPFNPFGLGAASAAALNYLRTTDDSMDLDVSLEEVKGTVSGEPFSTWAGPVSVAFGGEYDRNASDGSANPIAIAAGFSTGNFSPTNGAYHTTEAFAETVIPLAKDMFLAKSLEFNGGVRESDFSTSGDVTTWKLGATWAPMDDFHFRVTQSRDTRSPNLGELFATGLYVNTTINNPWQGNQKVASAQSIVGNPTVAPEVADTTGLGVVFQPTWLRAFSASFDYYRIKITDSLVSLGEQQTIDDCYTYGTFCSNIVQDANHDISVVYLRPENTAGAGQKGFDVEASYRADLADLFKNLAGLFTARLLATHITNQYTTAADGTYTPGAFPTWRYDLTLTYSADRYSISWSGRGVNAHPLDSLFIQCTANCPTAVAPYYTVNDNTVPGQFLMDVNLTYHWIDTNSVTSDLFVTVENIANRDPPGIMVLGNFQDFDDPLGRIFRAGIRFKM